MIIASGGISWTRVRVPRILSRIALAAYVLNGVSSAVGYLVDGHAASAAGMLVAALLTFTTWPLFIVSYILSLTQGWSTGAVEVDGDVLVVRKRRIPLRSIVSAIVVERPVGDGRVPTAEIELAGGDRVAIRTPDLATARALVTRIGFGPTGKRARFSLAAPTRRLLHPLLGAFAFIAGSIGAITLVPMGYPHDGVEAQALRMLASMLGPLLTAAIYLGLKRSIRAQVVTVGDDSVVVERVRRRFVPRRAIAAVFRAKDGPLVISLRDGSKVDVTGVLMDWPRIEAMGQAIEARHGPSAAAPGRFATFDRAGSALAEWRERIRVAMDRGGYRDVGATVDDASEVVRSPHATPEQRVGAAIALRVAGEPQRIRVAAQGVVDPDVRRALEAIARDDEPEADRALRRLSR